MSNDQPTNSQLAADAGGMPATRADALHEELWNLIANVSGGDWSKQEASWREAAARARERYTVALCATPAPVSDGLRAASEALAAWIEGGPGPDEAERHFANMHRQCCGGTADRLERWYRAYRSAALVKKQGAHS